MKNKKADERINKNGTMTPQEEGEGNSTQATCRTRRIGLLKIKE